MWSYGQTVFKENIGSVDDVFGDVSTFTEAMDLLYDYVEKAATAIPEMSEYETLLVDMKLIKDDPGIRNDPDQWEDEEFWDNSGELNFFVFES